MDIQSPFTLRKIQSNKKIFMIKWRASVEAFLLRLTHPANLPSLMKPLAIALLLLTSAFLNTISAQEKEFSWHDKGMTPYIASQLDPRFLYMLYIPKGYNENGMDTYQLLVLVHGTERRPDVYIEHHKEFADKNRVILLAPLFPLNTHGRQDLENYKLIDYKGTRYDLVLLSMIDEASAKYRIEGSTFSMHGFSGGGHFAHRFFYLHPHRLHAVSIGAPGMVTLIDNTSDWWVGTRDLYQRFNVKLNLPAMRRVNVHMIVGADDTQEWNEPITPSSEYWMGENVKGADYTSTGKNRIERLGALKKNYEEHGIKVTLETIPNAGHDETKLFPNVVKFLEGVLPK